MSRSLTRITALLLTLCCLLGMYVLPVSAVSTYNPGSPVTLIDGVIYNDFGLSQYYGLGEVGGHDYLYVPYNHMLYVYDLDTQELVDTQEMADGTSIGAFVDSNGIVWIYGAKKAIYRYDPVAKSGKSISVTVMTSTSGIDKLYAPIEVNGRLYFGTYGTAEKGGARIIEYNPSLGTSGTFRDLGQLYTDGMYCSAMTYRDGYIYATAQSNKAANTPQVVVKLQLTQGTYSTTITQVDSLNIHESANPNNCSTVPFFDDIQIAGDIMFLGGNPQTKMLAIDISGDTMKLADNLINMPAAGIMRGISEEVNGKIYFFTYNNRSTHDGATEWTNYNDFYSYDIATKTFTKLNTGKAQLGDLRSPQKSIVTIQDDALGLNGQYVLAAQTYPKTSFVLYGLDGSRHDMPALDGAPETANRLTSFTKGPDGTNTIYMGSYMNNTAAIYNYVDGTVVTQKTYSNQLSQNFHYNGKWYVTNYGACSLSEVGTDGTVTTLFALNEGSNKSYFSQERMHNFTAGGNKVFTSTVPHKGELGGFIAWYDYDANATYVAVEEDLVLYANDSDPEIWYDAKTNQRYTFTRDFSGLVADQMVKTLVYHDGLIYASTTTHGGSQSTPNPNTTPKLIVYDPTNMEMVATYDIRDGIDGMPDNIQAITGIVADPYVSGRFWGLVAGTLFNFTFNKTTKTFHVQEVLSYSKLAADSTGQSSSSWSPWKCYFDDNYLYYYNQFGTAAGSVIMVSVTDPTYYAVIRADVGHRWVLGEDNNFYFTYNPKTAIQKYNTASIVAQVKANGPAVGSIASNNGVTYSTVQAAIDATANASDKTVKLLTSTTENVTVPEGIILDLNGKTLTVTNLSFSGALSDSSDGNGLLKVLPGKAIAAADGGVLLYDSESLGYRVYHNFEIAPHGSTLQDINSDTKKLWFTLTFDNTDAYRVIKTGNSEIKIGADLSWTPDEGSETTAELIFPEGHDKDWATNMAAGKEYGFWIRFTGFEDLSAGTLKLTPYVNEVSSARSIVYSMINFNGLNINMGIASLTTWWEEA